MRETAPLAQPRTQAVGRSGYEQRAVDALLRPGHYLLAILGSIIFLAPFFWALSSSLKTPTEIVMYPPLLFPHTPQWSNYTQVWVLAPFGHFIVNSVIYAGLALIGTVASAAAVAYGFARFRFPGRDVLFLILLSTLVLPREVTMIPTFLMFNALGWVDSLKPLIVPSFFGGGAFSVFLLRQFFLTIPRELDEAAVLDGASSVRIFRSIVLPLSKPALATVAIFSFLGSWNDFLGPLIYLNTPENFPLSLGLRFFQQLPVVNGEPREHLMMAAAVMMAAPCILLFVVAQRYFVQGIVMSGLKG